jgi:chromosome segregation ATPase
MQMPLYLCEVTAMGMNALDKNMTRNYANLIRTCAFGAMSVLSLTLLMPSASLTNDAFAQGKGKGASADKSNNGAAKNKSSSSSKSSKSNSASNRSTGGGKSSNGSASNNRSGSNLLSANAGNSKSKNINANSSRQPNLNSQLKSLNSLKRNAEALENSSDPKIREVVVFLDNTEDRDAVAALIEQILDTLSVEQQKGDAIDADVDASAALLQETLDALVAAKDENALLEQQLLEKTDDLSAAQVNLDSANAGIGETELNLTASETELEALRQALEALSPDDDGYADTQAAISELETQVGALQTQLATQQSEAASLQEEVNSLDQTLTNISASLATLSDEIASFEQTSVQQSQDLELLELQQAEQQALLDDLNESLGSASDEFDRLEALTTDDVLVDALVAFLANSGRSVDEDDITDEMLEWAKQQLAL